jgi:ATP-dependent DNA helicase PIF1
MKRIAENPLVGVAPPEKKPRKKRAQPAPPPPSDEEERVSRALLDILATSLSPTQKCVYDEVLTGKSLFFTGEAGSGKSFLLDVIVKRARLQKIDVHVTASTGISACAIGGTTLHSFAGLGLAEEPVKELIKKIMDGRMPHIRKAAERWRCADLLVVDECSMLDPSFFNKLDAIARAVRKSDLPFGGIQVILTGDFFQLPPVHKSKFFSHSYSSSSAVVPASSLQTEQVPSMIFETETWKALIGDRVHILKETHRQHDENFLDLLRGLRNGSLSKSNMEAIVARMRASINVPDDAVKLYPTRKEVETVNEYKLSILPGKEHVFEATDKGQPYTLESNKDHWMVPPSFLFFHSFISQKKNYRHHSAWY